MKHLVRNMAPLIWAAVLATSWQGCGEGSATSSAGNDAVAPETTGSVVTANTPVTITQAPAAALFLDQDQVDDILDDLGSYFTAQNQGDWDAILDFYPLHRSPMDSTTRATTIEGMNTWWEKGLRNQTELADLLYASTPYRDGDQDVVLLNLDLLHRVIFIDFEGNPSGMKGMVESNYGKGNAQFFSEEGDPKVEYWEVRGDNRLWAVKEVGSDHWCFLPANFNERGGGQFMTVDAMTTLLRHRSENDPNRLR